MSRLHPPGHVLFMLPAHTRRKGSSSPDQESKRLAGPFLPDIEAVRKQVAGMVKNGIEKNTFFFLYFLEESVA